MHLNEWIAPVLGVFAARLALELQRIKIVNELRAVNNRLEARVVERTAALQKSNDELRAFSYSVSHDLRTPVRTINSFLSIVYEDHLQNIPTEAIDHLDRIQRAGIKLNSLIDDLLSLARITEKSILLKKFDLTKLIYETCDELMLLYAERNIILHVDANLSAWADEGLVRILMFNLISNALKYTRDPDQSKIEIGVIKEVIPTYFVRDNGIGMDMAYAAKIFQPFQRLHNESEFSGNGVGLATVQRIIDRHGGKIWVHSQPEQGSTFFFTLGDQKPIS